MTRGTTPLLTFALPFDTSELTKLEISFAQNGEVVLTKPLDTVALFENYIDVALTQEETLLFTAKTQVEIQIRCAVDECVMASNIMVLPVDRILKDGVI